MKHIIKKSITLMLAIVVAMGIMSFERKRVDAETKSLAVGTEYYFDDSIDFDGKWITLGYGIGAGTKAVSGVYPFHEITYNAETKWWQIVFSRGPGDFVFLYFHDSSYTGEEKVKGIKCVDGEGTEENPFIFELIIENTPADDPEPDQRDHWTWRIRSCGSEYRGDAGGELRRKIRGGSARGGSVDRGSSGAADTGGYR